MGRFLKDCSLIAGLESRAMDGFTLPIRIYWEDTDAGGIVFYANYLKFFERARTEWLRSLGVNQEEMRIRDAALLVVSSVDIQYLHPARLDDVVFVTAQVTQVRGASIQLAQEAHLAAPDGQLLCKGSLRIACVKAGELTPQRFPKTLAQKLTQVQA